MPQMDALLEAHEKHVSASRANPPLRRVVDAARQIASDVQQATDAGEGQAVGPAVAEPTVSEEKEQGEGLAAAGSPNGGEGDMGAGAARPGMANMCVKTEPQRGGERRPDDTVGGSVPGLATPPVSCLLENPCNKRATPKTSDAEGLDEPTIRLTISALDGVSVQAAMRVTPW